MGAGHQQQIAAPAPSPVACIAALDGETLGIRRDGAAEQAEQHVVAGMETLRARQCAGIGVGAGNAETYLDMEVCIGAGAAQVQDYGFGKPGELHHGVAREMGRTRREIKQMAAAGRGASGPPSSPGGRNRRSMSASAIGQGAPVAPVNETAVV